MFSWFKGSSNHDKSDSTHEKKIRIATSAVLIEIASADDDFTDKERTHIVELLKSRFSLSDQEADELMSLARKKIEKSIDLWSIAHEAVKGLAETEKLDIMETAWRIIYSDGELTGHEDMFVHKLYYLLGLTHSQMIDVKMKVMEQLRREKN